MTYLLYSLQIVKQFLNLSLKNKGKKFLQGLWYKVRMIVALKFPNSFPTSYTKRSLINTYLLKIEHIFQNLPNGAQT